jgi:hypothetical protein
VTEQKAGKRISPGFRHWILGSLHIEGPLPAGKLIAHLIVLIVPDLAAKAEAVLAVHP